MNYFIIEDIDNPVDKYFIVQTAMSYHAFKDIVAEAKETAEETDEYVVEVLEELLKDTDAFIIRDFDTMYI